MKEINIYATDPAIYEDEETARIEALVEAQIYEPTELTEEPQGEEPEPAQAEAEQVIEQAEQAEQVKNKIQNYLTAKAEQEQKTAQAEAQQQEEDHKFKNQSRRSKTQSKSRRGSKAKGARTPCNATTNRSQQTKLA